MALAVDCAKLPLPNMRDFFHLNSIGLAAWLGGSVALAADPSRVPQDDDPFPGRSFLEGKSESTNSSLVSKAPGRSIRTGPVSGENTNRNGPPDRKGGEKDSAAPPARLPETPREWLNAGTRHLNEGKLRDAEVCLENALLAQAENIQPTALYNAGHVRFRQGAEEIKKGPTPSTALARGAAADYRGGEAVRAANEALQSGIVASMVQAYIRGRGSRRELKQASEVVRQALQAHSAALLKWQRASGDFHSAAELVPSDRDSRHNAEVVDRHIARLIDTIRQLQEASAALAKQTEELRQKMKQLRGQIPQQDMPPGASGDEEEEDEEDGQDQPERGQREAPTQTGVEIELTPEQAQWLLEGFRLDRERRLPMGQQQQPNPRDRNRPDW